MDGSQVAVVVLGEKGVGKSCFIEHCFVSPPSGGGGRHSHYAKVNICGRDINVRVVDNPGRQQLVPAIMVILLFDLTQQESFKSLHHLLEVAQRVSPVSLRAVVGTKADLQDSREVSTQEALDFCKKHSGSAKPMPYYETSTLLTDTIALAFQEIMARPLINDYVIKSSTEQEQKIFVHEVMEWAITSNSANILTHLRELGYPIPMNIIEKYPLVIRDYLLGEYPLREVPRFKHLELKELHEILSWEDSMMDDSEETILTIQDTRPTIQVARRYHFLWKDISLPVFFPSFLDEDAVDSFHITHIDLSHNDLTSIPSQAFSLPLLESLDLSHNALTHLPPLDTWKPNSRLQVLKLSHNELTVDGYSRPSQGRTLICPALWHLDVSYNKFQFFPPFVLYFSLRHLDLSGNEMITQLPPELGSMKHLVTLPLHGLSLSDPPLFVVKEGPHAILHYLRLKLTSKQPWNSVRVVVVGHRFAGKTSLVSKIVGSLPPSTDRGLDVVEWKYRGSEIFSFRSRWLTFDLWDFSGAPDLDFMCASFHCETSLHLVVCNSTITGANDLVRQLADLQSRWKERILVLVVFTHMDQFKSREEREKFKKTHLQWLDYHNKQGGNGSFGLMATASVRSLQGEEMLTSYEIDPTHDTTDCGEVKGPDIPLMPRVLRIHFISCTTGEGIPNLRKVLYKIGSGSVSTLISSCSPHSALMVRDVPGMYVQMESMLRQLRVHHRDNQEGQQCVFYTLDELEDQLKSRLEKLGVTRQNLEAGMEFMHQMGVVYVHHCVGGEMLVCVDPQLIGCLLHTTVQACRVHQEANPGSIFLANTHLCMMWGVEPILTVDQAAMETIPSVTSAQLLHFLEELLVFSPLLPGVMLVSPTLPHTLPRSCDPDSTSLTPRRSYVFSYLPSLFHTHLISRVVAAIVRSTSPLTCPSSPNQPSPPATVPIVLPTGIELFLWQRNLFLCVPAEETRLWVRVREVDVGLDPLPHCGRIDVHIYAPSLKEEAHWLRLVTREIDWLLQEVYPGLLDSSRPQKVEIFVPFNNKLVTSELPQVREDGMFDGSDELSPNTEDLQISPDTQVAPEAMASPIAEDQQVMASPDMTTEQVTEASNKVLSRSLPREAGLATRLDPPPTSSYSMTTHPSILGVRNTSHSVNSFLSGQNSVDVPRSRTLGHRSPPAGNGPFRRKNSSSSSAGHIADLFRRLGESPNSSPLGATPPYSRSPPLNSSRGALLSEHSWEVVSKYSSTSNRLSILQDQSDPDYDLVPLWECLQEAFKTPVVRMETARLTLSHVIPDLLFADLPPEQLIRTKGSSPDHYLMSLEDRFFGCVAPPPPEVTGMCVEPYYTAKHADVLVTKPAGALKALYLQSCLALLRQDLLTLQQLRSPHLVTPVGLQYCPPSLALEAAPFGNLSSWMRRLRHKTTRTDTHHIALQLLRGLEFFHKHGHSYHCINSDSVLVWNLNPLVVKLSHNGLTHSAKDCGLCDYLNALPPDNPVRKSYRFDYMLLGLLVYEMATGKRPFADIYSLSTVVLAVVHDKVKLNVEADHFLQKHNSPVRSEEDCIATGCQRLCLQSSVDHCLVADLISHRELEARFSLCAGDNLWSPMRLLVNVEVMLASCDSEVIYWASGSRGLVTGSIVPSTGELKYNLLQEAPPPESGLFANRRVRPVPIAVGRASGLALAQETNQLWVGTENGQMGSVYVFKLPDMRRNHHIHLQDAVLSLCAINRLKEGRGGKEMKYRVLVGLANGTIILFLGLRDGKVLDNPLQGPKLVVSTHQRKPCLTMTLTPEGRLWCSCGNSMEVYDVCSKLAHVHRLTTSQGGTRGDGITLMTINGKGVWTVGRRSPLLRLWDQKNGQCKASYDVSDVVGGSDSDITALAVKGGAIWLGTRNGYLLILDTYMMTNGGSDPLLGMQQCGSGKVKCIIPITPLPNTTSRFQVMCSLEFADEVSCHLLSWEYFHTFGLKGSSPLDHTPKISTTLPDLAKLSPSSPEQQQQHCKSF